MKKLFSSKSVQTGKILAVILAGLPASIMTAGAQAITVPNFSFESPVLNAAPYYQGQPADNGSTGAWLGYGTFSAVVKAGGPNAYNVSPAGIDGAQFGDQSAKVGTGVLQDLTSYSGGDPNLLWTAGVYTLTVGFFSRADSPVQADDTLDMKLYSRTTRNDPTTILGDLQISGSQVNTTGLTDFTLNVTVNPGDASIGQPIGIWFDSTTAGGGSLGDWGYDNVRLSVAPVPEPGAASLMLLGLGAMFGVRRLTRRGFCG